MQIRNFWHEDAIVRDRYVLYTLFDGDVKTGRDVRTGPHPRRKYTYLCEGKERNANLHLANQPRVIKMLSLRKNGLYVQPH